MMIGVFGGVFVARHLIEGGFVERSQAIPWILGSMAAGGFTLGTLAYLVQRLIRARAERWFLRWEARAMSLASSRGRVKWSLPTTSMAVTVGSYYGTGTEHTRTHLLTLCFSGSAGPLLVVGCDYALAPGALPGRSSDATPDYSIVPNDFLDLLQTFAPQRTDLRKNLESHVAQGLGAAQPMR